MTYPPQPSGAQRSAANQVAPSFAATGLTGATSNSRYAGATASGAPVSGTFSTGDYVLDLTGNVWVCTAGGTPGTWAEVGSGGGFANPMTTLGDIIYENSTPAAARLAGNASATKNFLAQTGTGAASAAPAWGTIAPSDLPVPAPTFGVAPSSLGLAMLTMHPMLLSAGNTMSSEQFFCTLVTAMQSVAITKLGILLTVAGVTPGAGVNEMAVFSEAGTQLAITGDMTTAMESTGWQEGTLTSGITLTAGSNYYIAVLSSFSGTTPKYATTVNADISSAGTINGHYISGYLGSQATMPGSITPSGLSALTDVPGMYAR